MGSTGSSASPSDAASSPPQAYVVGVGPGKLLRETSSDRYEVEHRNPRSLIEHEREAVMSPRQRFDYLRPAADDPSRQVSPTSAVFSLLSTMLGGGVLSLPYAFRASGLIVAIVATTLSALASGFTIDLLIAASRSTGADTYELVAKRAFGRKGRIATMSLVFGITWLCQVAYLVLLADLLVPVLSAIPGVHQSTGLRYIAIGGAVFLVSPLCFQSKLQALRFMSVFAFVSLIIVVIALAKHAVENLGVDHYAHVLHDHQEVPVLVGAHSINLWPESLGDFIYVFPIFGLSFLCQFNALPIHAEMREPTRRRMKHVTYSAMFVCNILYLIAGFSGYIFAGSFTCGNILLNFGTNDVLINVSRVALSLTLMGTFPLLILPGRATLHQLLQECKCKAAPQPPPPALDTHLSLEGFSEAATEPAVALTAVGSPAVQPTFVHVYDRTTSDSHLCEVGQFVPKDESGDALPWTTSSFVAETLGLMISSVLVACVLDSVLVVWSVAGSTVSFMIAFIFPVLIWLKLHAYLAPPWKVATAKVLLLLMVLLAICCTYEVVINLTRPVCPDP